MTPRFEKNAVRAITIVAALIVVVTFWMNGAERDDAWLYLTALLSILAIPILTYPR